MEESRLKVPRIVLPDGNVQRRSTSVARNKVSNSPKEEIHSKINPFIQPPSFNYDTNYLRFISSIRRFIVVYPFSIWRYTFMHSVHNFRKSKSRCYEAYSLSYKFA